MPFKTRLKQGILSYIYHKIAEDGKFTVKLPHDFLKHVLTPFLSYYMSQIDMDFGDNTLKITGSSLVPVEVIFKNPVIRDTEIVIPFEMNRALFTFLNTFGAERLSPIKIAQDSLIVPTALIYNSLPEMAEDLKISRVKITKEGITVEIVSR